MEKREKLAERISEILVKQNALSAEKAKALKKLFYDRSKPVFVEFLLEEGLVSRPAILNALSEYYQKPAFDVVGHFFDENLVQMFPEQVMVRNLFVPVERDQNMLMVVASDPTNPELLEVIGKYVSYDVHFMVGIARDIIDAAREFSEYAITQYPEEIDVDIKREQQARNEVRDLILEEEEEE